MLTCAICADVLLVSDTISSTLCGHIFHDSCLSRWLESNHTCPQCRQNCPRNSVHRIYLPEHTNIGSNDLMEKLSEISKQKKDQDTFIKELEGKRRKLEHELKMKKKQYHKVLQRHIKQIGKHSKTANIPRETEQQQQAGPSTSSESNNRNTIASNNSKKTTSTASTRPIVRKRNRSRIDRAKDYFRIKRQAHSGNNNNNNDNIVDNNQNPSANIEQQAVPLNN